MSGEVVNIHQRDYEGMIEMLEDLIDKVKNGEVNSIASAAIMTDGTELYSHDNDPSKRSQMIGTLHRLGMHLDRVV